MKNLIKKFNSNESGMAIIMVTTAVAVLTLVLVEFTFETKLNKIRVENQVDRFQAKLNAEAGLRFALAKLKIYKEAWNTLEDNESLKKTVSPSDAEKVVIQPFMYPIPIPASASAQQKSALAEFEKDNLLKGELIVTMSPVTGFLNPNSLRVIKEKTQGNNEDDNSQSDDDGETALKGYQFMEKTFIDTIDEIVKDKITNDEDFAIKYSNINVELLVKELKYYVNNPKDYDEPEKADIDKIYSQADKTPKHAAFESIDELYMLEGWDDTLVNLIKDRLSVHQVSVININEITENQLKVLFPSMTPFQLETFFKYRDGDQELNTDPKEFKDIEDFKKYLTDQIGAIDTSDFDKRIAEFQKSSISLGVAAKLFKVISKGKFGRTGYQLTAFVDLPVKPTPEKEDKNNTTNTNTDKNTTENTDQTNSDNTNNNDDNNSDEDKKNEIKTYLLSPRIVEIRSF